MRNDVLYACFDLDVAPPGYNFLNFLVLADIAREELGLATVHVVFVPGEADGFRREDIEYPLVNKEWRLRQICTPALCLLPTCTGHTVCASRDEAVTLLDGRAQHVFPFGYQVDLPVPDHDYIRIVQSAAAGQRIDRLQAPGQARLYVKNWLNAVAGDRRVVTITLRESTYDVHRSSTNENWIALAKEIEARGFCPVLVRDTERLFETQPAEFDGVPVFPHAAVNLELRAALYAEAYLNTGINQGPWTLWHFLAEVPYLCVYIIDRMLEGWHVYHIDGSGFTVGEDMPFARGCQVTYWGDDHLEDLRREFWALVDRLEAGDHRRSARTGGEPSGQSGFELADRYRDNGQYAHALAIYRSMLDQDPDNLQVQFRAAVVSFEAGDFESAVNYLVQPLAALGPEPAVIDILVRAKTKLGATDQALALLELGIAEHPDDCGLLERQGDVLIDQSRAADARDCFRRALQLQPDSPVLAKKLADVSLQLGEINDAIRLYAGLIKDHPISVVIIECLARALKLAGRDGLAADCYEVSTALRSGREPSVDRLDQVIADCLQNENDSEAA